MSVPGVEPIVGLRFLMVDEVERFEDAHHMESYFGLTPGEKLELGCEASNAPDARGRDLQARWALGQAAWSAVRSRPSDPIVLWAKEINVAVGREGA